MATKADFNADEWSKVVEAPLLAGMGVLRAGRGGTIRESLAMGKVYAEARRQAGDSELLDALVASPPAFDPKGLQEGGGDLAAMGQERLREAVGLVREKGSDQDAEAYGEFVLTVARAAAEAHKEGGFAGIGGQQVSEEEQQALDQLRAVLDEQP